MNFFALSGIIVALVTVARYAPLLLTNEFLIGCLILSSAIGLWRWRSLRRRWKPQRTGSLGRLKSMDLEKVRKHIAENFVGNSHGTKAFLRALGRNIKLVRPNRHLGSFLIAGPKGTGKAYFSQILSEGLFGADSFAHFLIQPTTDSTQLFSELMREVKDSPYKVILLEDLDEASPPLQEDLKHFLETGQIQDPGSKEWFHAPGLILIATTSSLKGNFATERELIDSLMADSTLDKTLLSKFSATFWFGPFNPSEIIKISLSSLVEYFFQHKIRVEYVSPEILIRIYQLNQCYEDLGVAELSQVIRKFSDPLIVQSQDRSIDQIKIFSDQRGEITITESTKTKKRMAA